MRVGLDADITAADVKPTRLIFGNDQAMVITNGPVRLNFGTGAVSGKLNTLIFAFSADDLTTVGAREWQYVMLRGSGTGADKLNGGAGTDVFASLAGGITDANFAKGKAAVDTDDYLIYGPQGGKLYYDADGSGGQAAVQIAIVKGSAGGLASGNLVDADSLLV